MTGWRASQEMSVQSALRLFRQGLIGRAQRTACHLSEARITPLVSWVLTEGPQTCDRSPLRRRSAPPGLRTPDNGLTRGQLVEPVRSRDATSRCRACPTLPLERARCAVINHLQGRPLVGP
jgi:hypothetical protein